jgi:organic radical activating enzyme
MRRINDIFYSLQGEGYNTGRAAVFVRFAGCNLRCPFCDTEFDTYREMTDDEIVAEISRYEVRDARYENSMEADSSIGSNLAPRTIPDVPSPTRRLSYLASRKPLVVLTGGEPTLQVDEAFVGLLHQYGFEVAMESNGTRPAPQSLDWLTVSPKIRDTRFEIQGTRLPDELKVVFDENTDPEAYLAPRISHLAPRHLYLQPCDTGDAERNARIINRCVEYIKEHPHWRLSLQTHKLVGFK